MAGDLRLGNTVEAMTDELTKALADECERQIENCRDTAVSFITWLKVLRGMRMVFVAAPIVFGGLATWKLLADSKALAAVFTLLATVLPPVHKAINLDETIKDYETLAGEFTNLRDRFRQAKLIASQKPFAEFETEFQELRQRLEKARSRALAPPNWSFRRARKHILTGVYVHDRDLEATNGAKSAPAASKSMV
jgi:hypothetical protein